jgi:hypothetical protein
MVRIMAIPALRGVIFRRGFLGTSTRWYLLPGIMIFFICSVYEKKGEACFLVFLSPGFLINLSGIRIDKTQ